MIFWIAAFLYAIGLFFIFAGLYGLFHFNHFYSRILISSKVETVGFMAIMTAVIVEQGLSFFSLKVVLICLLVLVTNPLATHALVRSALKAELPLPEDRDG